MTTMTSNPTVLPRSCTNSTKRSSARVIAPGDGRAYWAVGDRLTFKLTADDTAGAFTMAELCVVPGGGPPPHLHLREDEIFYMLDGRLQFVRGGELFEAAAGDALFLPRGTPHAFKNASDKPARAIVFATPCGFENFIPEFGTPAEQSADAPPMSAELMSRLLSACDRHGLEIKFDHRPGSTTPVAPPDVYKPMWVLGVHVHMKLTRRESNGAVNLSTLRTRPGDGPPPHAHLDCDELFYVERGQYEFLVGDRKVIGDAGTTVYLPAGTAHSFKNIGTEPAQLLAIHTPGGFEGFYMEMGTEADDSNQPPTEPLDMARVKEVMRKHHMIMR